MKGFKIARIFGVDIEIHWSLIIIFGLIAWSLAGGYFLQTLPGLSFSLRLVVSILTAFLFIFSIVFHEMAHSLIAKKFNIRVRRITLFMLGGVAQLESKGGFGSPKSEFLISVVGPLSSAFLAGIFFGLARFFGLPAWIAVALSWLFIINLVLAAFNLIPAFPMDGGRIFRSICWRATGNLVKATRIAKNAAIVFGILLPVGGYFLGGWFGALWIAFISWFFLIPAANDEYKMAVLQEGLKGVKVKEIMERGDWFEPEFLNPETICHPEDDLKTIYERMQKTQKSVFFAIENGEIIGCITLARIGKFLKGKAK